MTALDIEVKVIQQISAGGVELKHSPLSRQLVLDTAAYCGTALTLGAQAIRRGIRDAKLSNYYSGLSYDDNIERLPGKLLQCLASQAKILNELGADYIVHSAEAAYGISVHKHAIYDEWLQSSTGDSVYLTMPPNSRSLCAISETSGVTRSMPVAELEANYIPVHGLSLYSDSQLEKLSATCMPMWISLPALSALRRWPAREQFNKFLKV